MADDAEPLPAPQPAPADAALAQRYRQDGETGRDTILDRSVTVRAADSAQADDLLREARFLARLEHAGIPCVHDFVRADAGALLIERQVEAVTLAEAVRQAAEGRPVPEIASPVACALTIIKACDAIAAAHARSVVHRALRPACIHLGSHGQVLVGDWRTAMARSERPETRRLVSGTPATTAIALDDRYEDVRGLGACLFTALTLQPPVRDGIDPVGAIPPGASARMPLALEAVVRQAMASDAANGYRSVAELAADLNRFVEGQLPGIYRPGMITRCLRWLEAHRRGLAIAALVLGLAVGATAMLYGRQIWSYATWGDPIIVEDFADGEGWKKLWKEGSPGTVAVRDGQAVTVAERGAVLVCKRRLSTPLAIEYTGTILPGSRPCDLSVWWTEHNDALADPVNASQSTRSHRIQAGAYENSYCAIFTSPGYEQVARANRQLVPGQRHRFRVQLDGDRYRMWIDGDLVLDYTDTFPTSSGYLALYGYFPGKAFDDIRIWQQQVPSYVSPLAIGDAAYQFGRYEDAAESYARVARSHEGAELGDQALFRQGLAERRLGDKARADATWKQLAGEVHRHRADVVRLADLAASGDWDGYTARFRQWWQERPAVHADLRDALLRMGWERRNEAAVAARLLALHEGVMAKDPASSFIAAELRLGLGRYEEVIAKHPGERRLHAHALLALGRTEEVLAADWTISDERALARLIRGDYATIADDPGQFTSLRTIALCKLGRGEEALRLTSPLTALVLPHLGRPGEVLDLPGVEPWQRNAALLALGRFEEAAAAGDGRASLLLGRLDEAEARLKQPQPFHRALAALAAGQDDVARTWRGQVRTSPDLRQRTAWFLASVGLPLLDERLGKAGELRRALTAAKADRSPRYGGRLPLMAEAAFDPSDRVAWDAVPLKSEILALQAVAAALRGELAGDKVSALAGWRAFRALPMHQRLLDEHLPDLAIEACAAWREAELGKGQP